MATNPRTPIVRCRDSSASTLCQACCTIFDSPVDPNEGLNFIPYNRPWKKHHATLDSFRQAMAVGCFICSRAEKEEIVRSRLSTDLSEAFTQCYITRPRPDLCYYDISIMLTPTVPRAGRLIFEVEAVYVDPGSIETSEYNRSHEVIKNWVSECVSGAEDHVSCRQRRLAAGAVREDFRIAMLEIQSGKEGGSNAITFSIRELEARELSRVPYAIVTHGWPDMESWVSHLPTYSPESEWCPVDVLPSGLQETIRLALAGGVSYVWEHHLPVRTSSTSAYPTKRQISNLYAGAAFNIASFAANTSTTNESADQGPAAPPLVHPKWSPDDLLMVYSDTFDDDLASSPLWGHASFHQAVLLSPATLYCGLEQPWFHCRSGTLRNATLPSGKARSGPVCSTPKPTTLDKAAAEWGGDFGLGLAELWTAFVAELSEAVAGGPGGEGEDRSEIADAAGLELQALNISSRSGAVASDKGDLTGGRFGELRYSHGLWYYPPSSPSSKSASPMLLSDSTTTSMLGFQLLWHPGSDHREPETWDRRLRRRTRPSAASGALPTWSWQSIANPVTYDFLIAEDATSTMSQLAPGKMVLPRGTINLVPDHSMVGDAGGAGGDVLPNTMARRLEVRGSLLPVTHAPGPERPAANPNDRDDDDPDRTSCYKATCGVEYMIVLWDCIEESRLYRAATAQKGGGRRAIGGGCGDRLLCLADTGGLGRGHLGGDPGASPAPRRGQHRG
ncbi:hypothetical protein PG994_005038 [Apiospora phragmitis]|uniref:Uncharacterized protein n=1 Tax=Apiospora phragmitis TaxID=2905665 RepID=A0ABR1VS99_9PEZI